MGRLRKRRTLEVRKGGVMVRVLDQRDVHETFDGDTLVRDAPERVETTTAPPMRELPERGIAAPTPRRPIRWMRWLAVVGIMVVAGGTALYVMRDGGSDTATVVPRTADGAEGWIVSAESVTVQVPSGSPFDADLVVPGLPESVTVQVPRTADGAEGWIVSAESVTVQVPSGSPFDADLVVPGLPESVTVQVPRTADGAEGWIVSAESVSAQVPRTADGAEGWIVSAESVSAQVPRTADGAEGWIVSTESVSSVPRG